MKASLAITLILMIFFLLGCNRHAEFDAKYAARRYCDCLQKERAAGKDFFDARAKCDGELLVNNRFFRLDYIGLFHGNYMILLPDKLEDSISKFHFDFYSYVENHCCKEGMIGCDKNDSLQIKMKVIDTIYTKPPYGSILR